MKLNKISASEHKNFQHALRDIDVRSVEGNFISYLKTLPVG